MSQVNELALNFPISSIGAEAGPPTAVTGYHPVDITGANLPADVNPSACEHISVYVDSTQLVDYDPKSPTALIDLVLSVSIMDGGAGCSKNYKMVKRLSLNKCKLACDAEHLTPTQVIEDEADPLEVARIMESFYAAKRAREIAGLSEAAGDKKFDVKVSYDDKDGKRETDTVCINRVRDEAHARDVFASKHAHKYPNAKIVRAKEAM